jgi:hypothetical protein
MKEIDRTSDIYDSFDTEDFGCHICGASHECQRKENEKVVWLGIGEEENCSLCGAAYDDRPLDRRAMLHERSLSSLLHLGREVDLAYSDMSIFMTNEQTVLNRLYFGRIMKAISEAAWNYVPNRYERCSYSLKTERDITNS